MITHFYPTFRGGKAVKRGKTLPADRFSYEWEDDKSLHPIALA